MISTKNNAFIAWCVSCAAILGGCGTATTDTVEVSAARTPITTTTMRRGTIGEDVAINATSIYQRKNMVRANLAGFVERTSIHLGDHVTAGQDLYVLRTKEAVALDAIAALDTNFRVKGLITVKAPSTGVVVQMDKLLHDYVNDGDQLAVIADESSFVFVMNVPYELNAHARIGSSCTILLADSTSISGTITAQLSAVDPVAQTQGSVVRPTRAANIPEGLIGRVLLRTSSHANTQVLPVEAVLGNEEMSRFWVMRLLNDSIAIAVPVTKGISTRDSVEVRKPTFSVSDRFVLTGSYGLADTAAVIVITP